MAKDLIIIDSCVFIKAFRRDKAANADLHEVANQSAYSIVTYLELLAGANTPEKKDAIIKIFESYWGIPLDQNISLKAIDIMNSYVTGQRTISVPDCLIAATSLMTGFPLLTYNKKDFEFIDGIEFYK